MKREALWWILCVVMVLLSLGIGIAPLSAQQRSVTRTWGLSASVQTGQVDILIPIWAGNSLVLAPGFNVNYVQNVTTNLGVEIVPRLYLDNARVSPYITGVAGLNFNMPDVGRDTTDLILGIGLGGEYFVNPKFSFGVEGRVTGFVFDLSTAQNTAISTSGAVVANVYF